MDLSFMMLTEIRSTSCVNTNQQIRAKLLNVVCRELDYTVLMLPTVKVPYGEVAKISNI